MANTNEQSESEACMVNASEQREREASPVRSDRDVSARDSDSIDNKMMMMFKMQHESNTKFQNQILQIVAAMANAQATPGPGTATLQSTSANFQTQGGCPPVPELVAATSSQLRLTNFDPDDTSFTMAEWLDDVTRIQQELGIFDTVIVLKAGHALRGRAARFYQHWKPLVRDWAAFRRDFEVAFPEQGTPATRIRECLDIKSTNFGSLVEYGNAKLTAIKRFYPDFPWNIILSLVEYDIQQTEAKNRICLQSPTCDAELLKLLAACDANIAVDDRAREPPRKRVKTFRDERPDFHGKCRKCHRYGHKQMDCKQEANSTLNKSQSSSSKAKTPEETKSPEIKSCTYCQKRGHTEDVCYRKHGAPKRVMLSQHTRFIRSFPSATITNNNTISSVSYLVDTGADVSVLHKKIAEKLNLKIQSDSQFLSGMGNSMIKPIGRSTAVMFTPTMTLEIDFVIVPDGFIPGGDIDALIGLDVIKRPGIKIEVNANNVDIVYDPLTRPRICLLHTFDENDLNLSGLDERLCEEIKTMFKKAINQTPPSVTTGKLKIVLHDSKPIATKPRHLAYGERLQLKQIIQEQLQTGIIRPSESAYASPIVLVKKRNGDTRLCVDFREINKRVFRNNYPLPRIQDQIDALAKAVYFCTLDMKSGFHQLEVEEDSKHITAFVTPDGLYEYNQMPFGFVNSPSCYQNAIDKALGPLKDDIAFVYVDDVLCPAQTIEEGLENLRQVVDVLSKAGFFMNLAKCSFFKTSIEYLGVVIERGTVKPSPRKVNALAETVAPKNVKGVRQFLGLAGYFRRFVKNFARLTAPISALLRKGQPFVWTDECETIRMNLVSQLTEYPVLNIFDPELPTELHTDASSLGLGAALMQRDLNNIVHPVAYYSRRTTECESRYHSYDLETLAIVEATQYFRTYLYGIKFTIYTDCNSVRATALKKELHPRVARWWIKLQDFDFEIEYRPGHKMGHVDYLSRNAPEINRTLVTRDTGSTYPNKTIADYQADDLFCQSIINKTHVEPGYTVKDNLVFFQRTEDEIIRCFVPVSARLDVMKLYHDNASHIGADKMLSKLREDLIWPRMGKTVRKYVANCRSCVLGKSSTGKKRGLCQQQSKPTTKLDTWHIDHAGPLVKSNHCTQILVIIDAFTKFVRFCPIKQKTTNCTIKALVTVFEELGTPKRIIADRGTAFQSSAFRVFLTERSVELHLIATGVPRGNGQVERVMRTLFNAMRSVLVDKDEKNWTKVLPDIEDDLNVTINKSTGYAPWVLMYGENRRLKATEDLLVNHPAVTEVDDTKVICKKVNERLQTTIDKTKQVFNEKRVKAVPYAVGDKVAIENSQLSYGGKLKPKFQGPFDIITCLANERYVLQRSDSRGRTTVAAHEQLRSWPDTQTTDV